VWPYTFGLKTYLFIYVSSMLVLPGLACWLCRRTGIRMRFGLLLGVCYFFGMCVGARILFDLQRGTLDWRNYLSLSYYFGRGLWGGPLAYLAIAVPIALASRHHRRLRLDIVALSLPIPMILAKVACFCNGCCWGAPTGIPWAVAFPPGAEAPPDVAIHPTQVYEILVLLVILLGFNLLDPARWRGLLLVWFVALYGIGRPLTEAFRGDGHRVPAVGPLTASQVVCLAAALVAGVMLLITACRRDRKVVPEYAGSPT
jgi:phosphatidylglycerol:prolipoprotein diacylglycerol transferase